MNTQPRNAWEITGKKSGGRQWVFLPSFKIHLLNRKCLASWHLLFLGRVESNQKSYFSFYDGQEPPNIENIWQICVMQVFELIWSTIKCTDSILLRIKDFKILDSTYIGYNIGNYSFQGFLIILRKTTESF